MVPAWGIAAIMVVSFSLVAAIAIGMIVHNREIRASEYKFRTIFQNVFDALFLIDSKGRILDVNNSACTLSGYSKKQLKRRRIKDLIPEGISDSIKLKSEETGFGELVFIGETKLKDRESKEIYVEVGTTRMRLDNQDLVLATLRDVNARKLTEMELEKKTTALRVILSRQDLEKSDFKNEIGHLVKNSLLPSLHELMEKNGNGDTEHFKLIETNLQKLASHSEPDIKSHTVLSPRELEVCNLIIKKMTSKEIAKTLNISLITVNKHREKIRKKLHITNKNINLSSFLKNYLVRIKYTQ